MSAEWLIDRMRGFGDRPALVGAAGHHTFEELVVEATASRERLRDAGVTGGSIVSFTADYSVNACATMFGVALLGGVAVPLSPDERRAGPMNGIAGVGYIVDAAGDVAVVDHSVARHPLVAGLLDQGAAGLVIFTSGSTGEPKAALHSFDRFIAKYHKQTRPLITVAVSPMDHIAGLDTLFYGLSSGGTIVTVRSQSPEDVLDASEKYRAQILPATPSFLRLMLFTGELERRDLSSLELVAYGAEVMPTSLLESLQAALPHVKFIQKFGMTEVGSPVTRSPDGGSNWIKLDPESTEYRIVDGVLWLRSQSAMLGYLNAPSPIDEDGWLNTGDTVEQSGDSIRVIGRASDMINVGGHKVNPHEVEDVILAAPGITSVVVRGEQNPMMGQVPVAFVETSSDESDSELTKRIRLWCSERLNRWQIPVRISRGVPDLVPERMKIDRRGQLG